MRQLRLASELVIPQPRKLLKAFVRHWYPMYDGVHVEPDNQLRVEEIALSTMLNSRISGNTGGAIWRARASVETGLASIPSDIDLLDVPKGEPIPGAEGISDAVTAMCEVARTKLSVSTKILHKKRPGLIPIFDSVVESVYWPRWCPSVPGRSWGDYAVALTQVVHRDMLSVEKQLRDLRGEMAAEGTPMTACRILNALTWVVVAGNLEWLLGLKGE